MDELRKKEELINKLRVMAARMEMGIPPKASLINKMAETVSEWERELEESVHPPEEGIPGPAFQPEKKRPGPAVQTEIPIDPDEPILIWCDGSCSPNPGAGGWGAIIRRGDKTEEISGSSEESTNNIMELTAAIESLRTTSEGATIHIRTDSQYVKNGITRWIRNWKRNQWKKAGGGLVLNQELWKELDELVAPRDVTWEWIRGHSGNPENSLTDLLANQARKSINP